MPLTIILSLVSLVLAVGDLPFLELPCPCDRVRVDRDAKLVLSETIFSVASMVRVQLSYLHRPLEGWVLVVCSATASILDPFDVACKYHD